MPGATTLSSAFTTAAAAAFLANKPDADGYLRSNELGQRIRLTRRRAPTGRWRYRLLSR